jgi:hypothetical protein
MNNKEGKERETQTYFIFHPFVVGGHVVRGVWDEEETGGKKGYDGALIRYCEKS